MPVIEIDFETRSLIDIKTCGAGRYAADPSTRILCVCWAVDHEPIFGQVGEEVPRVFHQAIKEGWTFSAFNAMFEQLIWKYRWPAIPVPEFRCTRALVASHGLPQNLDRACKALKLGWSKDIEGQRLIKTYSKPRKDGSFNELHGDDKQKMLRYCAKDVDLSRRIRQRIPQLTAEEQAVYNWTIKTNIRGLYIDPEIAEKAEGIASVLLTRGNKELSELTDGTIFSVSQIDRIKKYLLKEFNIEAESLDKEAIEELLLIQSLPDEVRRILELRRDLAQTSVKKFGRAVSAVCPDGRVRDTLVYHGAATGRWTSQVVQFQNLPRHVVPDPQTAFKLIQLADADLWEACYANPMLSLSGCIRGVVIPAPKEKFVVVDYAAIEARVLNWAAGQEDIVAAFHRNEDQYLNMAELIYRKKGFTKKDNPKERFLGKTTELGSGYGMGFLKFQATCESYGIDLGPKTESVERTDKNGKNKVVLKYSPLAKIAIETYRTSHPKVVQLWYSMQDAAIRCVRTGASQVCGKFRFERMRDFLYMVLPSGRRLAYHHPGLDKDGLFYYTEDTGTFSYIKKRTYGGRLVENAIQATARDILSHGILKLEAVGYPVVLTVHDENVISVPEKQATASKEEIEKIMCALPPWAEGCPVGVEGFICDRYRKG